MVVGAATRDVDPGDARGWRLGGGVSYGALTLARLGLPTTAILGADAAASQAWELELLRAAGVDLRVIPLRNGPVFENRESSAGRVQLSVAAADPIVPDAASPELAGAAGWLFAPVAGELPAGWAALAGREAIVALAWQGLLRRLEPGSIVQRVQPAASPLLRRADLVGLSRDDVGPSVGIADLLGLLRPGATMILTQAGGGGIVFEAAGPAGRPRRYPAIPVSQVVDPTGAGDAFLAAMLAARLAPELVGGSLERGADVLLGAVVASLVVEAVGLEAVPSRSAVRDRVRDRRRSR